MKSVLLLAWRYLSHYRGRTSILVACITLVFLLPVAVQLLVDEYAEALAARAESTPLVVGARGSRYDLVLNTLYFKGRVPRPLPYAEAEAITDSGLGRVIPLLTARSAQGHPVVGTTHDYYDLRALEVAAGDLPARLGDAVLGAAVARALDLGPGDPILTDRGSLYDLTMSYPLQMRVTGVLAETGGPDDRAVFCDVKTAWVIEGIGHGHSAAEAQDDTNRIGRSGDNVVLNAGVYEYTEIDEENVGTFHFHGERGEFPLTGLLLLPDGDKSRTILKGRFRVSDTAQLLVPSEVVDELLGFVFRVKVFFDANLILVTLATALFLTLIVLLTLRVRRRELDTLRKIGCSRPTVVLVITTELLLTLAAGLLLAALFALGLVWILSKGSLIL